jgi:ubiquinone/menaquinone biosynthesis C-methylase UbiE
MIPPDKIQEINQFIQEHGWDKAFEEMIPQPLHSVIQGADRADFRFFMPVSPNAVALDLGCMWGAWTFSLAQHCKQVIGIDQTFETLRMGELRKVSSRVTNVSFVQSDAVQLPFADCIFDIVIINGVLEWIGSDKEFVTEKDFGKRGSKHLTSTYSQSPRAIQVKALEEALRVLKPGGTVYIGIENRISWQNFFGSDPHSGLRFTSLMPRWLANLYMRLRLGKDYRTYTYSSVGLRKLLAEAGFKETQFFTSIPEYSFPDIIFPLEERFLRFYVHSRPLNSTSSLKIKAKILAFLGVRFFDFLSALRLATHFVDVFLVLAKKDLRQEGSVYSGSGGSMLQQIILDNWDALCPRVVKPNTIHLVKMGRNNESSVVSFFLFVGSDHFPSYRLLIKETSTQGGQQEQLSEHSLLNKFGYSTSQEISFKQIGEMAILTESILKLEE